MSSFPTHNRKFQKIAKKIKTTIFETFLAKISWERPRKRENKKNRSDEFVPDPQLKITKKKKQKNSKN